MDNIAELLNNINIIYNRKIHIDQLLDMLKMKTKTKINIIDENIENNVMYIVPIKTNELKLIEMGNNGNCFYEAIATALKKEIKNITIQTLRDYVSKHAPEEDLIIYLKIIMYQKFGNDQDHEYIRTFYNPGKKLMINSVNKFKFDTNDIKIMKDYVKKQTVHDSLFSENDEIIKKFKGYDIYINIIRNLIKVSNNISNKGLLYLDTYLELPLILNKYNIVIIDLSKKDNNYISIWFHKPNVINSETKYIITTIEYNHTNLLYDDSYKIDEIPQDFLNKIKKVAGWIAIDHGGVLDMIGDTLPDSAAKISKVYDIYSYIPNAKALLEILIKLEEKGFFITFGSSNSEEDQVLMWNALTTFAKTHNLDTPKISALVTNKPSNTPNNTILVLKPINNDDGKKFIRDTLKDHFKINPSSYHFIDDGTSIINAAKVEGWNAYLVDNANNLINILKGILNKYN